MKNDIVKILAEAFLHYPLMKFAFEGQDDEKRLAKLHILYTCLTNTALQYGGAILEPDKTGALIWLKGDNFPLGLIKEIQSDMFKIPFMLGIKTTLRLMNHDGESEGWIQKNAAKNMGYIWCVGVDKHERGKGIAKKMIEEAMAQMKKENLSEFWLKTEDEKNVGIYKKMGFEVAHHMIVKSSGIDSWAMKYNL